MTTPRSIQNIRTAGAVGDDIANDGAVIQHLLDRGERNIYITAGIYLVKDTLRVPSDTYIEASSCADMILSGENPTHIGDFLADQRRPPRRQ